MKSSQVSNKTRKIGIYSSEDALNSNNCASYSGVA